jgi:hypothetical protein
MSIVILILVSPFSNNLRVPLDRSHNVFCSLEISDSVRCSSNDRYSRVSIANYDMKRHGANPGGRLLPHLPAHLSCDPPMFAEARTDRGKKVIVVGPDGTFQLKRSARILDLISKDE